MKVGTSCSDAEVDGARDHFDYVEVWNRPVAGEAFHYRPQDALAVLIHAELYSPYVVIHTDDAVRIGFDVVCALPANVFVENVPGDQPDEVARVLEATGKTFLFDVGHAYTSAKRIDSKTPFDYSRWWALGPKAMHFHDCRDLPNPWGRKDAADHQILSEGVLPLVDFMRDAKRVGVEYVTLECFMYGWLPFSYVADGKRIALDRVMRSAFGEP